MTSKELQRNIEQINLEFSTHLEKIVGKEIVRHVAYFKVRSRYRHRGIPSGAALMALALLGWSGWPHLLLVERDGIIRATGQDIREAPPTRSLFSRTTPPESELPGAGSREQAARALLAAQVLSSVQSDAPTVSSRLPGVWLRACTWECSLLLTHNVTDRLATRPSSTTPRTSSAPCGVETDRRRCQRSCSRSADP